MFDVQIGASVRSVKISVTDKDGIVRRKCRLVLEREFDEVIAAGLGKEAKKLLASMKTGGIEDATLPMGEVNADAQLVAAETGDKVKIGSLRGCKAKATAGADVDDPPSIRLEFEFAYNDEAWSFLGRNCGSFAHVTLRRRQMELVREAG